MARLPRRPSAVKRVERRIAGRTWTCRTEPLVGRRDLWPARRGATVSHENLVQSVRSLPEETHLAKPVPPMEKALGDLRAQRLFQAGPWLPARDEKLTYFSDLRYRQCTCRNGRAGQRFTFSSCSRSVQRQHSRKSRQPASKGMVPMRSSLPSARWWRHEGGSSRKMVS